MSDLEAEMQYWFNVDSKAVESHDDPDRARSANLLGPYDTEDEAEAALEKAAKRTEEWEAEDKAWDNGDAAEGDTANDRFAPG
ncbi:MAG: methionine aminopeptidase [Ornithinimicrobium sp.]